MDLSVKIPTGHGDFVMKNPVMPAAATFGNIIEYKDCFDLSVLGAMMPNSIAIDTGSPTKFKKYFKTEYGFISSLARNNISIFQFNDEIVPQLPWQKTPIIVDLKATDADEMEKEADAISRMEGIAGIEINLNCPYGVPGAEPYWKTPEKVKELVKRVKAAVGKKLVVVKNANPEVPMENSGIPAQQAGADAFCCFNGMGGRAIDIRTRKFQCGGGGGGGYSGVGIKPYALNICYTTCQALDIPVFAAGGVQSAADVLEYVMAGATVVQVGSANLNRPDLMAKIVAELPVLMKELGIRSMDEIRGCATV